MSGLALAVERLLPAVTTWTQLQCGKCGYVLGSVSMSGNGILRIKCRRCGRWNELEWAEGDEE